MEQLQVINILPHFFSEEEANFVGQQVSLEELEGILKSCAKDKSPRLDDWTTKFFIHFFYMLGHDVLKVVEESRVNSTISSSITTSYLALIPKCSTPISFK